MEVLLTQENRALGARVVVSTVPRPSGRLALEVSIAHANGKTTRLRYVAKTAGAVVKLLDLLRGQTDWEES